MARSPLPLVVFMVCLLLAGPAGAQPPAPASPPADRPMPLDVIVNGHKSGTWVFVERGGVLYAPREAFEEWRVHLSADAAALQFQGEEYRALAGVAGFRSRIDFATQSIEIFFSPQAFATLRLTRELAKRPVPSPVLPSVFLNYDLSYSAGWPRGARRSHDLGAVTEVGISTGLGVLTHSSALQNLAGDASLGTPRRAVRLETTFTRDFPQDNRTLRIGDTVTRRPMWGRDVFFGGVRYGTNFALTPGFSSQPLPAVSGLSAAPSTVELYLNDVLRQVSRVPAGPFVIDNFPVLSGNGEARVVVRDLLGRETVVVQPFFSSADMLARGLHDWSVEAGALRRELSRRSNDYGEGFASGTWRHGVSNTLTVEGRAEMSRTLRLIGAGMLTVLPWQVLAKAALVGSSHSALGHGGHWLLGLEHQALRGGASIEYARSTARYRELGQAESFGAIREQIAGSLTYASESLGTFGLGFASIERYDRPRLASVSANYSVSVARKSTLTMNATHVLSGGSGTSFGLTFLMPLDGGAMASATYNQREGQRDLYAAAVRNPLLDNELGWRVLAGEQQGRRRAEGGVYYQGEHGTLSADVTASSALRVVRLGARGGVVGADGHVFVTRRADESFAIAEVPGYGDIGVGIGSNVLARTNAEGIALVPRLLPYIENSVRINARELPISAQIDSIEQVAVPAWRSAVKVQFPVRTGRGALLRIVLDDGEPAPAGAVVRVRGDAEDFYVARRGEAFVTGLKDEDRVSLRWKGGQCEMSVTLPPADPDEIPRVGPLACKGVSR